MAQTTSSGGVKNTQMNSAYVTPVVTRTYSPQADPYTWDANKSSFVPNSSYIAPASGAGNGGAGMSGGGLKFALGQIFGRPRSEGKLKRLSGANARKGQTIQYSSAKMYEVAAKITKEVTELANHYDSGYYFDARQNLINIDNLQREIGSLQSAINSASGQASLPIQPPKEQTRIENFYSLLTYNRVGRDYGVLSEYLENYTNCYDYDNALCWREFQQVMAKGPPYSNSCGFRECPEKVLNIEGLPLEDIFEIELAFTESAALVGYTAFAAENLKSVMDFYTGKVQLLPYYLYLASIQTVIGQSAIAEQLYNQYKKENENELGQKLYLQLYLQKMALYFYKKGDAPEGKKFEELQRTSGYQSATSQYHLVNLLMDNNYKRGRENKLITEWLLWETSSLLQKKDFIKNHNDYCNILGDYTDILVRTKDYSTGMKIANLQKAFCPTYPPSLKLRELRYRTGEADSVLAYFDLNLYGKDEKGKMYPMEHGKSMTGRFYMQEMNDVGNYTRTLEVFEEMKRQGVKKNVPWIYEYLEGEAFIAYYHLKEYSKAKKMMGDLNKTAIKYKRYYAKYYAQTGNLAKAKEIYESISYKIETKFDDEDIQFMDQQ